MIDEPKADSGVEESGEEAGDSGVEEQFFTLLPPARSQDCSRREKSMLYYQGMAKSEKPEPKKAKVKKTNPLPFVFTHSDKTTYQITAKQKQWADIYIDTHNATFASLQTYEIKHKELFEKLNGQLTDEQKIAKDKAEINAATIGRQNSRKLQIIKYIDWVLDQAGFTDESVKFEHFKLIKQDSDFGDKARGIDMFYKVRGSYAAEKVEHGINKEVEEALERLSKLIP